MGHVINVIPTLSYRRLQVNITGALRQTDDQFHARVSDVVMDGDQFPPVSSNVAQALGNPLELVVSIGNHP